MPTLISQRLSQTFACATLHKVFQQAIDSNVKRPKFHTHNSVDLQTNQYTLHRSLQPFHFPFATFTFDLANETVYTYSVVSFFIHSFAEIRFSISMRNWNDSRTGRAQNRANTHKKTAWQLKFSTFVVHFVLHANSNESLFVVAFSFVSTGSDMRYIYICEWECVCTILNY